MTRRKSVVRGTVDIEVRRRMYRGSYTLTTGRMPILRVSSFDPPGSKATQLGGSPVPPRDVARPCKNFHTDATQPARSR
jgi:hypothetical protein